jgi:hypothetical protein
VRMNPYFFGRVELNVSRVCLRLFLGALVSTLRDWITLLRMNTSKMLMSLLAFLSEERGERATGPDAHFANGYIVDSGDGIFSSSGIGDTMAIMSLPWCLLWSLTQTYPHSFLLDSHPRTLWIYLGTSNRSQRCQSVSP